MKTFLFTLIILLPGLLFGGTQFPSVLDRVLEQGVITEAQRKYLKALYEEDNQRLLAQAQEILREKPRVEERSQFESLLTVMAFDPTVTSQEDIENLASGIRYKFNRHLFHFAAVAAASDNGRTDLSRLGNQTLADFFANVLSEEVLNNSDDMIAELGVLLMFFKGHTAEFALDEQAIQFIESSAFSEDLRFNLVYRDINSFKKVSFPFF